MTSKHKTLTARHEMGTTPQHHPLKTKARPTSKKPSRANDEKAPGHPDPDAVGHELAPAPVPETSIDCPTPRPLAMRDLGAKDQDFFLGIMAQMLGAIKKSDEVGRGALGRSNGGRPL